MEFRNTICAVSADSPGGIHDLLERMIGVQSGGGLSDEMCFVDDSGMFGIATSGNDMGDTFFHDPARGIAAAFSGRIINMRKLAGAPENDAGDESSIGHASVIASLYLEHGTGFLDMLHGQFSFIIWDGAARQILAFRDQMGFMPLFYCSGIGGFQGIASRVSALVGSDIAGTSFDCEAIRYFLCDKAFAQGQTPFRDVRSLEAGGLVRITTGNCTTERYYAIPISKEEMSEHDAILHADSLLREVLEENIQDFDDIGILFSGGVDSMLLLSAVKSITDKQVHTYSVLVDSSETDNEYIAKVSEHFGTKHTNLILNESTFHDQILDLIKGYMVPGVGGWHVHLGTRAAGKDGIRSLIAGFGGELVFGVPSIYKRMEQLHRFLGFLNPDDAVQGRILGAAGRVAVLAGRIFKPAIILKQYVDTRYGVRKWYSSKLNEKILSELFLANTDSFRPVRKKVMDDYVESGTRDLIDMLLYSRMKNFEGNKVLGQCNEIAHSNNVELCIPLMDRRMVQFGFSIPNNVKYGEGLFRHIELELGKRFHRFKRAKSAFSPPIGKWLNSRLPEEALSAFSRDIAAKREIFRSGAIEDILQTFQAGESELAWADVYAFISLEVWLKNIME
jgi:asparagine synthase (glutamine-hydrolysing)